MKFIKNILASLLGFLPDHIFCKITFFIKQGRFPELHNPKLFNDKLLYLKLNDRKLSYSKLVDKYKVREYVAERIGKKYLVPLIGIYNQVVDIKFSELPDSFVLKITNGSQNNIICNNKNDINWDKMRKEVKTWCNKNYYNRTREWPYKNVENRIIVEELIKDNEVELKDYKFWCFNGVPKFVQIDSGRFTNHRRDFYDTSFNVKLPIQITYLPKQDILIKPDNYDKMLEIASELSKGYPFLRIDLYNVKGRIYFGEITFYPGNCNEKIRPLEYEQRLGDQLDLNI